MPGPARNRGLRAAHGGFEAGALPCRWSEQGV